MRIARLGIIIGALMMFDVSVGGLLTLQALMPDSLGLLRALLVLVVAVQLVAFMLWMLAERGHRARWPKARAPEQEWPKPSTRPPR